MSLSCSIQTSKSGKSYMLFNFVMNLKFKYQEEMNLKKVIVSSGVLA